MFEDDPKVLHSTLNQKMALDQIYIHHEKTKKREYKAQIMEVEKGNFTSAVFSCSGRAVSKALRLLK